MKNDDRVEENERRIAGPVASYLVRVWSNSNDTLHGIAKHVQSGVETPFASGSALVEILNSKTQPNEEERRNEEK